MISTIWGIAVSAPSGELIQNQFRIGLLRLERVAKERMSTIPIEVATPSVLVNTRPVVASIREFFSSSQLSQFMDQPNPLAELTHKTASFPPWVRADCPVSAPV